MFAPPLLLPAHWAPLAQWPANSCATWVQGAAQLLHAAVLSPCLVPTTVQGGACSSPCRFAARVQGAEQPFYTTADEGEEFTLDQPHFCRAIATGECCLVVAAKWVGC